MKFIFFSVLAMLAGSAYAGEDVMLLGDAASGEKLVAQHCTKCHGDGVYRRKDRRVKTIEGLKGQMDQCQKALDLDLKKDQYDDILAFLNTRYYKFGMKK